MGTIVPYRHARMSCCCHVDKSVRRLTFGNDILVVVVHAVAAVIVATQCAGSASINGSNELNPRDTLSPVADGGAACTSACITCTLDLCTTLFSSNTYISLFTHIRALLFINPLPTFIASTFRFSTFTPFLPKTRNSFLFNTCLSFSFTSRQ